MSSRSSSSCLGTFILFVVALILVRWGLPGVWHFLGSLLTTAFITAGVLGLLIAIAITYFTIRSLRASKEKQEVDRYARVTRAQELYRAVVGRLQKDLTLNDVSAEELLQSEILVGEKLKDIKTSLVRLKDLSSEKNEKQLSQQSREYKQEMQRSSDASVKQVIQENLAMLEEKRRQMNSASEEIREKEASVDLIYHSLQKVDADLNLGKPVRRLFPDEVYARFGIEPPPEKGPIPPLKEKSSDIS